MPQARDPRRAPRPAALQRYLALGGWHAGTGRRPARVDLPGCDRWSLWPGALMLFNVDGTCLLTGAPGRLRALRSSPRGLSAEEVALRRAEAGPNSLPLAKRSPKPR